MNRAPGCVAAMAMVAMILPVGYAAAAGDPYIPDAAIGWCPGGLYIDSTGSESCRGTSFDDGSFYEQRSSFTASVQADGWSTPRCSRIKPHDGEPDPEPSGCERRGLYVRHELG